MLCFWEIRRSLHIDKIHKNDNSSFLIIVDIIAHVRSRWKENSSEIHAHEIYV